MSDQKMGTHYVREICAIFKDVSASSEFPEVKDQLTALAGDLEPLAKKLYFKTQKGTEDMQEMAAQLQEFGAKLSACSGADEAAELCKPYVDELEKVIKHVKTMKVRMT